MLRLALLSDSLEYPISTDIGPLKDNRIIMDLLSRLMRALTSRQSVEIDQSFRIDATVVDGPNKTALFESAGSKIRPKTYRGNGLMSAPLPLAWNLNNIFGEFCGKSAKTMPDFSLCDKADPLIDCCFLAAIIFCMVFNASMRNEKWAVKEWEIIKRLHNSTQRHHHSAVAALLGDMRKAISKYNLDLSIWRNCALSEAGNIDDWTNTALREEIKKIGIRVVVLHDVSGYRQVFSHPVEGRKDHLELATVLLIRGCPSRETYHAAAVFKPEIFVNGMKGLDATCRFCGKLYSRTRLKNHKCTALPKRCEACKKVSPLSDTYRDKHVDTLFCVPDFRAFKGKCRMGVNRKKIICPGCGVECASKVCLQRHKSGCSAFSGKEICQNCNQIVQGEHICYMRHCR